MPVSHIGLTVSHLPTSTSFFLSALQPLGYRYIGQSGNQIGFGIREADFFLCQETPGVKAGAAHIAFTAPSTTAVRNFYAAALNAGGRPNGAPATRCAEDGHFNAAVLDFDGNSIEVVYRDGQDIQDDGTVIEHSRVITWQRSVAESFSDSRSVVSHRTLASRPAPSEAGSKAPTVVSNAPSIARSATEPASTIVAPPSTTTTPDVGDGAAKKIIGTLLGAAAGAAVVYAMVRSEHDSAKKEAEFSAFVEAKATVKAAVGHLGQASSQLQRALTDPQPPTQPALEAPPPHRNIDAQSYHSSTPPQQAPRQIEAAPASYYAPSHISRAQPQFVAEPLAIEYAPAYSTAPSQARSKYTAKRSVTSPELLTIDNTRSVASTSKPRSEASVARAQSVAHSVAPSSLISSFVPDRRESDGSEYSHHSSRSKARSSHTHASRRSSHSKHSSSRREEIPDSSPSPPLPTKAPSKAATLVSTILGRNARARQDDLIEDLDIEELSENDFDTVVPSDSISQIGSPRRSHRSHRSHHKSSRKHDSNDDESTISKQSTRSHRSHRSHKSHSKHHDDSASDSESSRSKSKRKEKSSRSSRPSIISEPSDASTVRPIKPASTTSSSKRSSRKDSVTQGQYENLFDEVRYGAGSVAAGQATMGSPTPSMISAAGRNKTRTMTNYAHAQRLKAFE